jgi:PLP dependent protein
VSVAENLVRVNDAIAAACRAAGRLSTSVRLVAASKGQPAALLAAAAAAGQRIFGENYAREMREKRSSLAASGFDLEWHFIGRVQAGNAKDIATAALVHGVGSIEQARALARRAGGRPVPVLLQVSLWSESTKNGFSEAELRDSIHVLQEISGVALRGLMAMPPPPEEGGAEARAAFAQVRVLRDSLARAVEGGLPELSMGMSGDYPEAVLEGATLVRVGTALFGPRPPPAARREQT